MRIGYACLPVGAPNTGLCGCTMKNADATRLMELVQHNLSALEQMLRYNARNRIQLFRISSDLIPFGSSPVNSLPWWTLCADRLRSLGELAQAGGIRLSMHPGQYTVLNSPRREVVEHAMEDLKYHARLLDSLLVGEDGKIILHVGGAYGDKKQAMMRFALHFEALDIAVRRRIALENDDQSYTIEEVMELAARLSLPVVFDNLHHSVNPCPPGRSEADWIAACRSTWSARDGRQKIHYSQQDPDKRSGSHSPTIRIHEFLDFVGTLGDDRPDVMLEVKDKNLSAVKCLLCTDESRKIGALESEWSRYKYAVLEKSPDRYAQIRKLLRDKHGYPALEFYELVESALAQRGTVGHFINAAQHIWGYFKQVSSEPEKARFLHMVDTHDGSNASAVAIKRFLWKMAEKYQQDYLADSLYFIL